MELGISTPGGVEGENKAIGKNKTYMITKYNQHHLLQKCLFATGLKSRH